MVESLKAPESRRELIVSTWLIESGPSTLG